jgi:hypothetical protein
MSRERKLATWNPLILKILMGITGAGLLAFGVFHQPWIPVDITAADTGVLVALPAAVPYSDTLAAARPASRQQDPIDVPLAKPSEETAVTAPAETPPVQTASITKPEPAAIPQAPPPTYAEHIAPLLERHCVECHQEEKTSLVLTQPFQVQAAAPRIAEATQMRRMPPWKPKAGIGHFRNERRLSGDEIDLFQKWAQAGAPMGDVTARPQTVAKGEWRLGKPTVAYQLPEAFEIPASPGGTRWSFVIPTGIERDLYLTGAELRPGNIASVRRMILSFDPTGTARKKDEQTPQPGFSAHKSEKPAASLMLAEWAPGMLAQPVPKDTAYRIPAGADLILTVDYADAPPGATDPWSMGLHLTRSAPDQLLGRIEVAIGRPRPLPTSTDIDPPQEASYQLPADVRLHSIRPEYSAGGHNMRVIAITPTDETVPLLEIENWEENLQERYYFREPVELTQGSRIVVQSWMENSPNSPNRGKSSVDCRCVFEVTTPQAEHLMPLMRHNRSAMSLP